MAKPGIPSTTSGTMNQKSEERPQCPEDARAPDYDNNHPNDWVRGANEDATRMPHYDKSKKWK
jgi:hypothetical protein